MPKHEFGLMEKTPRLHARYDKYEPEKYRCLEIEDYDIEPLLMDVQEIPCFYHTRQKPGTGLAYCGITLIPPESAEAFYRCFMRMAAIVSARSSGSLKERGTRGNMSSILGYNERK